MTSIKKKYFTFIVYDFYYLTKLLFFFTGCFAIKYFWKKIISSLQSNPLGYKRV